MESMQLLNYKQFIKEKGNTGYEMIKNLKLF